MCSVWIEVIARPEMETENLGNIRIQPILYKELRELRRYGPLHLG